MYENFFALLIAFAETLPVSSIMNMNQDHSVLCYDGAFELHYLDVNAIIKVSSHSLGVSVC